LVNNPGLLHRIASSSLFSLLIRSCIYCWNGRCEINQNNSVNIPESSSYHFPWRLHCLELLFDWRVRMLPGHRFSLALWGILEDPVSSPVTVLLKNASPCSS
jgi:hypothetical protein